MSAGSVAWNLLRVLIILSIVGAAMVPAASAGVRGMYGADVLNQLPAWYTPGTTITLDEVWWIDPTSNPRTGPDAEFEKPPYAGEFVKSVVLQSVDGNTYSGVTTMTSPLTPGVPPGETPWTYTLGEENRPGLLFIDLENLQPGPNGQEVTVVGETGYTFPTGEIVPAFVLQSTTPPGLEPIAHYRWVVEKTSGLVFQGAEYGYAGGASTQTTDPTTGTSPGPSSIVEFKVITITQ
ncbi:hypothetical protein F8E02_02775 [Methanoculleus sp. Wushi-C6]|uniref:DUF3821 domain-containing protein n=1 Tax=Methanoculleus caldifontis TaxID=2651577 RepID=A0ABU3WYR4_9EURY|nr:hypothetical protein [Methanoculleus sp. Wushi-C6]MDV2480949.1 hypothetical protein [Methanoculleus sp. Wushi-C6]